MTHPPRTPEDYERFIYTLAERFPSIRQSTLTFVRRGSSLARVAGELLFDRNIRLVIRERLDYRRHRGGKMNEETHADRYGIQRFRSRTPKGHPMEPVYRELAAHLDNLPGGYPPTESGVELRILKRLFSPEEAAFAAKMTMIPETPAQVAARLGRDEADIAAVLEDMAKKGLLFRLSKGDSPAYMAAQFVVGIWEYHLNDLDVELIRDVNEYLPHLSREVWQKTPTKQMRVIPISKKIAADMEIMPYDVAEELIRKQSRIVVADCICRKEKEMVGEGCGHPMGVCLAFGAGAFYYEKNGLGRAIDAEEALKVLETGREAGLVLQPGNAQKPVNICMCCGCCCQILKNLKSMDRPALAVHSNYVAEVDAGKCTVCGDCAERCHMDAIALEADAARVDPDRCIGCGLCVGDCPAGAMIFREKEETARYVPPPSMVHTYMNMAKERGKL
jgi:Na+-translocating ferredoxin:NAD+ oxidoreductase subunit B